MRTSIRRDGSDYVLLVERRLEYGVHTVWRALTESDLLEQWFPARIDGEWSVGSALTFTFPDGAAEDVSEGDLKGEVLAVEPPHLLEFRWGEYRIKFDLEEAGEHCVFRLSERFEDRSWAARSAAGWEMCLENLDRILDGAGASTFSADVWRTKFRAYAARFAPEFGPQSDPSDHDPRLQDSPDA